MKKIGIITLTRQNSLAYECLKRTVSDLGYTPLCGEAVDADSIFLSREELTLTGYDFLGGLFEKAGFSESDAILISAPYSGNLFTLSKVIWCLRNISSAPIVVGGNEAANNYANMMWYRHTPFVNQVVDVAPDFIVRGAGETVLPSLLPLLDKSLMGSDWDRSLLNRLLKIPNIVFWLPARRALFSTPFSPEPLPENKIFSYVHYGEKSVAVTLQRACVWAKKSSGGCLFCAIASQFGADFHCAVQSGFFVDELHELLIDHPEITYVDLWDDTFNIDEQWALGVCDHLASLTERVGREIVYSCFLRPKGLTEKLTRKMGESNIKVAFVGADALTAGLSKRMRRGCTVPEINKTIQLLKKGKILPRLSVQLFSAESTLDDTGITATLAMSCIHNGESTVHVHLYTFPLFGSDFYRLLEARGNLKKIPTPLMKRDQAGGFTPYRMAYDYVVYDPDLEEIKKETFGLLGITASFSVKTVPGDDIDGKKLKTILEKVRTRCMQAKENHPIKSAWYLILLYLEGLDQGLGKKDLLDLASRGEPAEQVPEPLRGVYGNFGYAYTLARSFDEVAGVLLKKGWMDEGPDRRYRLTPPGLKALARYLAAWQSDRLKVAAYGGIGKRRLVQQVNETLRSWGTSA